MASNRNTEIDSTVVPTGFLNIVFEICSLFIVQINNRRMRRRSVRLFPWWNRDRRAIYTLEKRLSLCLVRPCGHAHPPCVKGSTNAVTHAE